MMVSNAQPLIVAESEKLGCLILEVPILEFVSSLMIFLPKNRSSLANLDSVEVLCSTCVLLVVNQAPSSNYSKLSS